MYNSQKNIDNATWAFITRYLIEENWYDCKGI